MHSVQKNLDSIAKSLEVIAAAKNRISVKTDVGGPRETHQRPADYTGKRRICKYPLKAAPEQFICAPIKKVLDIQVQDGKPVLWAIADESTAAVAYKICAYRNWETLPEDCDPRAYLSTTQNNGVVRHWFVYKGVYAD